MMIRKIAVAATAVLITSSSLAYAEEKSSTVGMRHPSAADLNALTDARVGIIKAALQLTPDQEKYWPTVEEAIRARERRTGKPGWNGSRNCAIAAQWKWFVNAIRSNSCSVARRY